MRDLGHYRNVANRAAVGPIEDLLEYLANEEIHHKADVSGSTARLSIPGGF